jgi:hypothetical protein
LSFPKSGLEVVEREVADLVLETAEIHGGGVECGALLWCQGEVEVAAY